MQSSTKPSSIEEAVIYILERYVFTPENYPSMEGLKFHERRVFAVRHILLHINKNLYGFIDGLNVRATSKPSEKTDKELQMYTVKMLINVIKLAEIVEVDTLLTHHPKSKVFFRADWSQCLEPISKIAAVCEAYEHTGIFDEASVEKVAIATLELWSEVVGKVNHVDFPWGLHQMLALIPDYMKSN